MGGDTGGWQLLTLGREGIREGIKHGLLVTWNLELKPLGWLWNLKVLWLSLLLLLDLENGGLGSFLKLAT